MDPEQRYWKYSFVPNKINKINSNYIFHAVYLEITNKCINFEPIISKR